MAKRKRRPKFDLRDLRTVSQIVVYRVQDADGRGPWKPGFSDKWVEDRPDEEYLALAPIFVEFPQLPKQFRTNHHYGVGCRTIPDLRRWITKTEFETLKGYGYDCYEIRPQRIIAESDIQCVFESDRPLRSFKKRIRLYR